MQQLHYKSIAQTNKQSNSTTHVGANPQTRQFLFSWSSWERCCLWICWLVSLQACYSPGPPEKDVAGPKICQWPVTLKTDYDREANRGFVFSVLLLLFNGDMITIIIIVVIMITIVLTTLTKCQDQNCSMKSKFYHSYFCNLVGPVYSCNLPSLLAPLAVLLE